MVNPSVRGRFSQWVEDLSPASDALLVGLSILVFVTGFRVLVLEDPLVEAVILTGIMAVMTGVAVFFGSRHRKRSNGFS